MSDWDDLAALASAVAQAPIGLVSFSDGDEQWTESWSGLESPAPGDRAFSEQTLLQDQVLEVFDAAADERFREHPLVRGPAQVRFYAGAPILAGGGSKPGTVCVFDRVPRRLSDAQRDGLQRLARIASGLVAEGRRARDHARWTALIESSLEATADGLVCLDGEGRVLLCNLRFVEMWGFSPAEVQRGQPDPVLQSGLSQLRDPEDYLRLVAEQEAGPGQDRFDEVALSDGRIFERYSRPQRMGGAVVGRVNSFRDITGRRQLEKLKNEFVATVSHELRTPLTSIRGALGLLEGGVAGALPEAAREFISIARENSDRLIRLVNDILDLEKLEAGRFALKLRSGDPAELVRAVQDAVRPLVIAAGVELSAQVEPGLFLRADPDRILQVLTNLVGNAVKFSPGGSRVDVRVRATGALIRFEVEDRGRGLSPAQKARLFLRFEQGDQSDTRRSGGTGLGLAISKAIVEQHRGRVGVESVEGEGSTFWFEVPQDPDRAPPERAGPAAEARSR